MAVICGGPTALCSIVHPHQAVKSHFTPYKNQGGARASQPMGEPAATSPMSERK